MPQPSREELRPFAKKLHEMQFHGQKPKRDGTGCWPLHGIVYLADLRGRMDRLAEEGLDAEDA